MTLALVWGLPTLPELTVREARPVARLARPLGRPDGAAPGTTEQERNGQVTLAQASGAPACSVLGPRPQGAPRSQAPGRPPGTVGEEAWCGRSSARLAG